MKYKHIILSAIASLSLLGCSNEPAEILQAEPDFAFVELSSSSVVVDAEEGTKTLFVASNREMWKVQEQCDWLDVSVEENAITLYINRNTATQGRMAVVEVVAGDAPDVAKARLKVYQSSQYTSNLSIKETANCYIAQTEGSYRFNAKVKGNGTRNDGNSRYIEMEGVEIIDAAYASLAWEATYDADKTRSTHIIAGSPVYSAEEGVIYFSTGDQEGNALISLHNHNGEILWSWHIWVTNSQIGTSTAPDKRVWMDRNLGALNNNVGDVANRGMLYQWGRKEPFLPSPAEYIPVPEHSYDDEGYLTESEEEYVALQAEIEAARQRVNINNTQVGDGDLKWNYVGEMAPVALTAPGNIDYALQHPTTLLACRSDIPIGEYVFDWYLQQDLEGSGGILQQSQSYLWGNSLLESDYKTIFDPCPVGYVVPPTGAFDYIPSGYACTDVTSDWKQEEYGWKWQSSQDSYFPSAGNFDVSGLIGETGEKPLYWTSESFGSDIQGYGKAAMLFEAFDGLYYGIYPILDPQEAASWFSYGAKCMGASVRCVKEQK